MIHKSYAEIKQTLDNLVNKMSMEELEILLEKAREIKQIKGEDIDAHTGN